MDSSPETLLGIFTIITCFFQSSNDRNPHPGAQTRPLQSSFDFWEKPIAEFVVFGYKRDENSVMSTRRFAETTLPQLGDFNPAIGLKNM